MTLHAASRDMTTAPTARHTPNVPEADVQVPEVESGETGSPKLPVSASTPRHHAPGKAPAQSRRVLVGVRRGAAVEVPPVSDFPGRFFTMAEQFEKLAQRPQADDGPWGMGFGCEQGFVRADNQDYGIAYRIGGFQVLIIADGVGGTDWGREAAYFATLHAASSLARRLGRARGLKPIDVEHAAFAALVAAAHALARVGDKLGVTTLSAGLRTTLLVVVAAPQEIGFACCGDGLVAVAGADGRVRQLLQPQKAAGHRAFLRRQGYLQDTPQPAVVWVNTQVAAHAVALFHDLVYPFRDEHGARDEFLVDMLSNEVFSVTHPSATCLLCGPGGLRGQGDRFLETRRAAQGARAQKN